jgi:uncharacterized protein (TIGR02996 family)
MTDEAALLAAILAHPDEDTPRLVYADWLDEHGQPERAEFIRIQCDPNADEAAEDRAVELEERNRAKWLAGLPQFPGAHWEFRRGFPEYLDAAGALFLDHYEAFARVLWLRFLTLHDLARSPLRDFANRPWGRWVELELQEHPVAVAFDEEFQTTPAIVAVANCPQVAQLRRLHLSFSGLAPAAIQSLVASRYLESLAVLQIDGERDHPLFDVRVAPLRERFRDRLVIG